MMNWLCTQFCIKEIARKFFPSFRFFICLLLFYFYIYFHAFMPGSVGIFHFNLTFTKKKKRKLLHITHLSIHRTAIKLLIIKVFCCSPIVDFFFFDYLSITEGTLFLSNRSETVKIR